MTQRVHDAESAQAKNTSLPRTFAPVTDFVSCPIAKQRNPRFGARIRPFQTKTDVSPCIDARY
jgi:hypothetical protein